MTGKVLWHMTMSLDGFIAGPDDNLDWMFGSGSAGPSTLVDEVLETTGAFMAGGRLISDDPTDQPKPYGGIWTGPIFLLTHRDPATAPESITYLSGDIGDAVEIGLKAADGKNLVVTGGSVPRQCIAAGLVDEIVVHVLPVLLGDGIRFFDNPGGRPVNLEMITAETGQRADFRFRVVK